MFLLAIAFFCQLFLWRLQKKLSGKERSQASLVWPLSFASFDGSPILTAFQFVYIIGDKVFQ